MTNQVTLKVNEEALVRHLKFGFTHQATVLGELMQNARRARARQVAFDYDEAEARLIVTDDGIGIADLQRLLTVAESGWDAETIEQEHPFGLGFLAAVYAAEHIAVESLGSCLSFATADLLAFQPLAIEPCPEMRGTRLVLDGVWIPHLEAALRQRARGFPIPVYYNGEALPRPHALDSGRRFDGTAVGDVYLHGAMSGENRWGASPALACYLQGLPVHATAWEHGERTTLVHLDSCRFLARLPDRDTLIHAPEAIDQVEKEVARLAQERLRRLKAELPAEQFVLGFACLGRWKALSLLNDVPYVPAEVLSRIEDYPMIPRWDGDGPVPYSERLLRAALDAGQVRLARLDGLYEEAPGAAVRWVFAWRMGYTIIDAGALDAGHWVHPYVKDLDTASFDIEIVGPGKVLKFEPGRWLWGQTVRLCEAYRITIGEEILEVTDAGLYHCFDDDDAEIGEILIPQGEASGRVVHQVQDFKDEWDQYQEHEAEEEEALMQTFILAHRSETPEAMLAAVLRAARLRDYPALEGRSYWVHIGTGGTVAVDAAA